jgi:hypothetical protein
VTREEENKVIDGYNNVEFLAVLLGELGPVGAARLMGWAALFGVTGKREVLEARDALIGLGLSPKAVYLAYAEFRRLRRALLAHRGIVMQEKHSGPNLNADVPKIIERVRDLQNVKINSILL